MKRYYQIITFALSALLLSSCKDFLDVKVYDRTVPKTTEDYSALVHNICSGIDNGDYSFSAVVGGYASTSGYESIADNMEVNLSASDTRLSYYIGNDLNAKQSVYTSLYEQIRNANIILGNLRNDGSQAANDIYAFSYALRGVCYYQLLRMFCAPVLAPDAQLGVPIVTEFNMEAKPLRSSVEQTIRQIENDLRTSLSYNMQDTMYLFTPDVVHGYLARLYHWCGRWQDARNEALPLLEKYPILEGEAYKKMLSRQYGLVGNRMLMADRLSTNNALGLSGTFSELTSRPLSIRFIRLFPEGKRDVRFQSFWNLKRQNKKLIFSGLRSDELAFIAMESAYHLGNTDQALRELNDFRAKRITDYVPLTQATLPAVNTTEYIQQDALGNPLTPLLQAILNERRKEMYMENGDRWFELKRNGRPEWWIRSKGKKYWTRKYMFTFPLPVADVELVSGLNQNPGYEETE